MAALVALLLLDTHVKMPTFALLDAERGESGRIDMLGKHASRQRDRGFESHPLRHRNVPCKIGTMCVLNCHRELRRWDSNEGDRGGDTPLRGETRGGRPPQWERAGATSNAHPLRHVEGVTRQAWPVTM